MVNAHMRSFTYNHFNVSSRMLGYIPNSCVYILFLFLCILQYVCDSGFEKKLVSIWYDIETVENHEGVLFFKCNLTFGHLLS